MSRTWLPNLSELLDRLSIHQLKEVFIPEHKDKYRTEMEMIKHDIDELLSEGKVIVDADILHAIIILAQMNAHIWYNETKARSGNSQDFSLLRLTHGLNGIRNRLMNFILCKCGNADRLDYKTDCLAADFKDWQVGLLEKK